MRQKLKIIFLYFGSSVVDVGRFDAYHHPDRKNEIRDAFRDGQYARGVTDSFGGSLHADDADDDDEHRHYLMAVYRFVEVSSGFESDLHDNVDVEMK